MATVSIEDATLRITLSLPDTILAVHGSFAIPLANVAGASTVKPPGFFESLKVIGTNMPLLKLAGTFLYHGESVFFDYGEREERVLVVDLASGGYKHIFVHVDAPDTPAEAAARITAACAAHVA
jgi:hypothetical protein